MNPQFPHDSIYASIYPPNTHQPASSSRPHSQGIPHSNTPAPHGLPPLTSGNNSSSFGNEPYSTRTQPLPSPLLTRHGDHVNRPSSFPVYGPTAHTYFNAQTTNFVQAPQSQHSTPQSRPHSTSAQSQPHYTSAPGPSRLPDLLPMPPRGNGKLLSLGNEINPLQAEEETRPTHVVGSQGRRGILPSAAGRPAAVAGANTSGQKAAPTPPKDAEGKYPCPHCNKNYLHAKHLKRHLLRHTGVRPYTCGLCEDTFSRSDILKRHFQKCSVRRGNPSGATHLSHSRANKKSRAQEDAARMENHTPTIIDHAQQMGVFTPTNLDGSFDINALTLGQTHYEGSNQVSRSNSVKKSKRSTGSSSNRASMGMINTSGYDSTNYGYASGHVTPDSITTSGAATPFTFPHESRSNQISPIGTMHQGNNGMDLAFGGVSRAPTSSNYSTGSLPHIAGQNRTHDIDWSTLSHYNPTDEYGNAQYHSGTNTPLHRVKSEHDFSTLPLGDYPYLHSKA